jgi:hypothetical protein
MAPIDHLENIEQDTWYHVAVTVANISSPLEINPAVPIPGVDTAAYLFVSRDDNGAQDYEDFHTFDPTAVTGIGSDSNTDFAPAPLVVGGGPIIYGPITGELDIPGTSTFVVNGGASDDVLTFTGIDFEALGVSAGDILTIQSPSPYEYETQDAEIVSVAGDAITIDQATDLINKPNAGAVYTGANDGDFTADFTGGKLIINRDYSSTPADYSRIGNNFVGKICEIRLWKQARKFGQIKAYRYKQLPISV